jgi:hypothetical protein
VSRGIGPQTEDESLQEVLDAFWSLNKLDGRILEFTAQLFALGEQCYPVFVRVSDGRVKLAYFGPDQIERVIAHPDNAMELYAVVIRAQDTSTDTWRNPEGRRVYRIVRREEQGERAGKLVTAEQATLENWENVMLKQYGRPKYDGTVFYYRVNAVSNQVRGQSELLPLSDWLDQCDETLFGLGEREQFGGYFSWDVTVNGADKAAIRQRSAELGTHAPARGSLNLHNEKEIWQLQAPDLKQAGSIDTYKALLTHILGGAGVPQSWYGYGDETNRATAQAQADPTWRTLKADQGTIRAILMDMCEFARDQAIIAGALKASDDQDIDIPMPEMTSRDTAQISQSLATLAAALLAAVEAQMMSKEHAVLVWYKLLDELGMDLEPPQPEEMAGDEEEPTPEEQNMEAWRRSLFGQTAPLETEY